MAQQSTAIAKVFQNSSDLSSLLSTECEKRKIPWETVSKDVLAMRGQPEPQYVFPDDLHFTVDVTLNESKIAYKNLLSGMEKKTMLELLKLEKYRPLQHSDPAVHPLRQFQYTDVIRDWMREDSKVASN